MEEASLMSERVNKASCEQLERFVAGRGRRHRMRAGGRHEGSVQQRSGGERDVDVGSLQSARLLICSNPNDGLCRRPRQPDRTLTYGSFVLRPGSRTPAPRPRIRPGPG